MVNIDSKIKKLIEENPAAFGTIDKKNRPNVIGVAYIKVVAKNKIVITDNFMKQTKHNLSTNKHVCLAVWDRKWNGCKIIGTARYFTNGKWKKFIENMKENKGLPAKGAIVITISKLIKLG